MGDPAAIERALRVLSEFAASSAASRPRAWSPDASRVASMLAALDARVLIRGDADYPGGLESLADPPPAIYLRGTLGPLERSVAIVGSRAASPYGVAQASRLAADLAGLGLTIVSGLARGIDAAAHRGALEADGSTVAVLPGGLDVVTPRHHRDLSEAIVARGALVTEWSSGPPVAPGVFVRRNRLIAALASVVVVVEAAEVSGALSTAAAARRIGRAVLAVPGDVDRPSSRGCHALIRGGARLCEASSDVIAALPQIAAARESSPEDRLMSVLAVDPETVGTIARRADLAIEETLAILLRMEWSGLAAVHPGSRWSKRVASSA